MTRIVDRGAIVAAYVGIGMAVTIAVSFLLVIPIEPIYWLLVVPAGLTIGYYANSRSNRAAGPWGRILANGLFAGFVTGLTLAALLLGVKGLFFFADNGYPGLQPRRRERQCRSRRTATRARAACTPAILPTGGATCWPPRGSPTRRRSRPSIGTSSSRRPAILLVLTSGAGLGGALLYGLARPRGADAVASAGEKASPA